MFIERKFIVNVEIKPFEDKRGYIYIYVLKESMEEIKQKHSIEIDAVIGIFFLTFDQSQLCAL